MLPAAAPTATVPAWIGVAAFAGPILAVALAWYLFRLSAGGGSASDGPASRPSHSTTTPMRDAGAGAPAGSSSSGEGRPAGSAPAPDTGQGLATVTEVAAVLAAMADLKPDGEPMTRADVEEYVEAFRAFKQQGAGEEPPAS